MDWCRHRITLGGAVQGVGFRPFVYRLARSLELGGFVRNTGAGLLIEVEGRADLLETFSERLRLEHPPGALVTWQEMSRVEPHGDVRFDIAPSDTATPATSAALLNDLATCADCLRDLLDPANRRYEYPFVTCTACGPRFTITEALPYDRPATTMRAFAMCEACQAEYDAPLDRRFHAQPNACPVCGPQLTARLTDVAAAIERGAIVALKGIGGFQLLCDARRGDVVERLRFRKAREHKPLAVMMPTIETIAEYCEVSTEEAAVLTSPAAPIVLMRPRATSDLARSVRGSSPWLAVMLPYSPVHHLLMRRCQRPIVATSGNLAGEPIAIDNHEARRRLGSIADVVVTHDRPIARPCDDSVVRVGARGPTLLRRARGYAPLPIRVNCELPRALAVGGHLKNTIAIGLGRAAVVSQHLGDLDTAEARRGFERAIDDLERLHQFTPQFVIADLHPDYASTQWADACGSPVVRVQHHEAHVAACAAENHVDGPYLGIAWDGAGYGRDGTVWGGEFFLSDGDRLTRVAHLRPFPLLGGDVAAREGWRVALAMDWTLRGRKAFDDLANARVFDEMLSRRVNSPDCTSVGRLFDGVAALSGVAACSRFEGEAAMALEGAIDPAVMGTYPFGRDLTGDWAPLLESICRDVRMQIPIGTIAARFHWTLVEWACRVADAAGVAQVVLSGGVFQNACLADGCVEALTARGHTVHTHHQVPANDGGLSLGQLALAYNCA
jgi:hydrogenase maturation protein HypF